MIPQFVLRAVVATLVFLVAMFGTMPSCWAQKTLAWKFKKGGVTNVLIDQDTNMQLEMGTGTSNQTQSRQTTNITWTVDDVASDGLATIEQKINRVQFDLKSALGNFTIDTSNTQKLTGLAEDMAKGIRPLAGSSFMVKTKLNGEVAAVEIPEEVSKRLDELSKAGLREIAANGSLKFPTKPIDVGENWPAEYELDMPPFGKLVVSTTYQYLGDETVGGRILDRIKATTAVKVKDPTANSGLKLTSQEGGGMIWFDNTRGSIDHSEFSQDMSMSVRPSTDPAKPGVELKQVMKQTTRLKYAPQL
jgi:hypothetical protein